MSTIKDTVENTLGFHGQSPTSVTTSIIDALEIREAAIQADLLRSAIDAGLDEDLALDTLHWIFSHQEEGDPNLTFEACMASVMMLTRALAEAVANLSALTERDANVY